MRGLGRLLAALVIAAASTGIWYLFGAIDYLALLQGTRNALKLELAELATLSVGYRAQADWVNFPLPKGTTQIRLISTADVLDLARIRRERTADPRKRWTYALEYEVLASDGSSIVRRVHHHRTDLDMFRLEDGRETTSTFYLSEDKTPMTGVIVALNLAGLAAADQLRIRLVRKDDDINGVLLRVYLPEKATESQVAYRWQRLNEKQKTALARGSVFSHELLLDSEKRNLLLTTWQPVGPRGVRGRDYVAEELHVLRDTDGEPVDLEIPPAGLLIDPEVVGTIPIPETGGHVRLRLQASARAGPPEGMLTLSWYGRSMFERQVRQIPWSSTQEEIALDLGGGLLEIRPPQPMTVQAFIDSAGKSSEITPPPIYLRAFIADAEHAVDYAIDHAASLPTPFRVVVRSLRPPGVPLDEQQAALLRYQILDATQAPLHSGVIALSRPLSRYERLAGDVSGIRVVEGAEYFFSLPPGAARIRFLAGPGAGMAEPTPLLIAAQTAPPDLPRQIRVPEDVYDFGALGERIPGWFSLRPVNYEALVLDNRSRVLLLQPQPPDERLEILAGRFQWEDFRPAGAWLGRSLLTPRERGMPLRPEALPATFAPIAAGSERLIDFPAYLGTQQLTPSLAWINPADRPIAAELWVDGRLQQQVRARGIFGEASLGVLSAGRHRVALRADDAKGIDFFVNHTGNPADALVKRLVLRLDGRLRFSVERRVECEEFLSLRLFQPGLAQGRTQLKIRVKAPQPPASTPLPGWLFGERDVDVRPDPSFGAPLFETAGRTSDAGQPIIIPIPAGWPRGRYEVEVTHGAGPGGWVALSRLSTVLRPQRRILQPPGSQILVTTRDP